MRPLVSVIIATYNSRPTLPRVFDGILSQGLESCEVVVVDDCSEAGCADIVEGYRRRGLDIRLIESCQRLFTKNARLLGVEAARGEIVTFIDSDDWWRFNSDMAALIERMLEKKADVLHFSAAIFDSRLHGEAEAISGDTLPIHEYCEPYGAELRGRDIFEYYCRNRLKGQCVWGKLYTRELLLRSLPLAKSIQVHRYCEDLFLSSIFLFQARHYIGVPSKNYIYRWHHDEDLRAQRKGLGRAITMDRIRRRLVPYFESHGASQEAVALMRQAMTYYGALNIVNYSSYIKNGQLSAGSLNAADLRELVAVMPLENYLELVLRTYPTDWLDVEKELLEGRASPRAERPPHSEARTEALKNALRLERERNRLLRASLSWKITAPLRWLYEKITGRHEAT